MRIIWARRLGPICCDRARQAAAAYRSASFAHGDAGGAPQGLRGGPRDGIEVSMAEFVLICLLAVCGVFGAAAVRDSNRFVTVSYRISDVRIRKKVRLVLLADLHNKQYSRNNEKLLGRIAAAEPDLVVCAGDMVTSVCGKSMEPAKSLVGRLAARYPFYYAPGNHESRLFREPEEYGGMGEEYRDFLKSSGAVLLENGSVSLPSCGIRIYGLDIPEDKYRKFRKRRFPEEELEHLLGQASRDTYCILLAHHPAYFDTYAQWGADLTLSGHLHGGVMRLPFLGGVLSTSFTLFPRYDGGLFEKAGRKMVVSRGLGSHTIPIRVFNPAELVVIDLEPEGKEMTGNGAGSEAGGV